MTMEQMIEFIEELRDTPDEMREHFRYGTIEEQAVANRCAIRVERLIEKIDDVV